MNIFKIIITLLGFYSILFAHNNLNHISLQLQWKHQFEFAGFYIAQEKGYYKDAGFEVELKEFDSTTNITDDVVSGKTTFGVNYPNVVYEKANGKDVVILSAILQSSPHTLLSLESSNIESVSDFKNKTIMSSNDALTSAPFISMLQKNKLTFNDMKQVQHTFDINDIIEGKADIVNVFTSNEPYMLQQKGIPYKIWDPRDYGFDFYDVILFTSGKLLRDDPQMVDAFNKASIKGWEYAFENIEETVEIILEKYNTQNKTREALLYEAKTLKELAYYNTNELGKIEHNKIQRIYDIYNLLGYAKNNIDLNSFIYQNNAKKLILTREEKRYLAENSFNIYLNNWLPISIYNEKTKEFSGLSLDYWNKVEEVIPIQSNLIYSGGFLNSIEKLKSDKHGLMISLSKTYEREKYGHFSKPYVSYPIGIATNNKEEFVLNLSELNGKTVAVGKNYSAHKLLQKHYPKIKFVPVKNTIEAIELLARGEVYGAADNLLSLKYYLQKYAYTNLKISGTSDFKFEIRIMSNKESEKLIPILNKAIAHIAEDDKRVFQNKWLQTIKQVEKVNYDLAFGIFAVTVLLVLFFIYRQRILKDRNNQFQSLLDATMEAIFISDKGICIDVNKSAIELLGYKNKEDMVGRNLLEFVADESKGLVKEKIRLDNTEPYEGLVLKKDKTQLPALIRGYNVPELNMRISSVIDITHLKQLESQTKMAALGEMIGNIAHQWRQPLSIISTGASGLKLQKEFGNLTDEKLITTCEAINDNAQYLSKTIDDFKNFIKGDRKKQKFFLIDCINSFLNLLHGSLKAHDINVVLDVDETIEIDGYENELIQCLINITNNAKDALSENKIDQKALFISLSQDDSKVIISIKDNAGGISDDIKSRIFEPYFTTKHQSKGTGLGLHMVYNLIHDGMDGDIEVHNEILTYKDNEYKGANFVISLPSS